jgi:hypothetical protein
MSWFQGLSAGKICLPCKLAPGPRSGSCAGVALTIRGRVVIGVGEISTEGLRNGPFPTLSRPASELRKGRLNAPMRVKPSNGVRFFIFSMSLLLGILYELFIVAEESLSEHQPRDNPQFVSLKSISQSFGAIEICFAQHHDTR